MKELTFVHCNLDNYSFVDRLATHGFSLESFHCKECISFSFVSKCRTPNCKYLQIISFGKHYVGTLEEPYEPYEAIEVSICDSKSDAFTSALEKEGWHQVIERGTLTYIGSMKERSWYVTTKRELIVDQGSIHNTSFKVIRFEELLTQEKDERDLAELNPIAELLGKPTQLTKEEDAYNRGYNAALADFLMALNDYDIDIAPDDKYLTYMKIFNKMELVKEALQKSTNSKEV